MSGCAVALDQGRAHARISLGRFEFSRHPAEEAGKNLLFFHTDDAVEGAAHAHIGLVGRAPGQYALVGSGYVRVGSDYRGNPSV